MKLIALWISVVATIYHAVPEQTSDSPHIAAWGFTINLQNPKEHRIIAVSRDLEKKGFNNGSLVCVSNAGPMNGVWVVRDRMNKRWEGRIDFLVNETRKYGKWEEVNIKLMARHGFDMLSTYSDPLWNGQTCRDVKN
jgi:3D (Asp-Asp-Asp) domain-containing protein